MIWQHPGCEDLGSTFFQKEIHEPQDLGSTFFKTRPLSPEQILQMDIDADRNFLYQVVTSTTTGANMSNIAYAIWWKAERARLDSLGLTSAQPSPGNIFNYPLEYLGADTGQVGFFAARSMRYWNPYNHTWQAGTAYLSRDDMHTIIFGTYLERGCESAAEHANTDTDLFFPKYVGPAWDIINGGWTSRGYFLSAILNEFGYPKR